LVLIAFSAISGADWGHVSAEPLLCGPRILAVRVADAMNAALVRSAVAPAYALPRLPGTQISQLVLGMRVELLSREDDWVRMRGEDGYIGWMHSGYVEVGPDDWAFGWERGAAGEPVVSLGAELVDEDGRVIMRPPWGARLLRRPARTSYRMAVAARSHTARWWMSTGSPTGSPPAVRALHARHDAGSARPMCGAVSRCTVWIAPASRRPSCGCTVLRCRATRTCRRRCPGHGGGACPGELRAGDLLFFADHGQRVSHVAIALGGSLIIHSALGNGGVTINDIDGSLPLEQRLRGMLVRVRRVLAD
jgi:hypothetical protein